MFQRRLKIVLLLLVLLTLTLMARAAQVQVLRHAYWKQQGEQLQTRVQLTATTRGQILDIKGRPLAIDIPCTDVAVAYPAILDPPDPRWVAKIAHDRLADRYTARELRALSTVQRQQDQQQAVAEVQADIKAMWMALADCYRPSDAAADIDSQAAVDEIRRGIVQDVQAQRRWLRYEAFLKSQARSADESGWRRWLAGLNGNSTELDEYDVELSAETEPHVILRDVDAAAISALGRRQERYPGLQLQASTRRSYPLHTVACHLLGRVAQAKPEDIARSKTWDLTRRYQPTDDVGRNGVEALCEPLLRGSRGRIAHRIGQDEPIQQTDFIPGQDVTLSIDADLQSQIQQLLQHVRIYNASGTAPLTPEPGLDMHAAAVVIDVKTGQVRAMASNPAFDVNDLADHYSDLLADKLADPLRNRATSDEFEPGSTVKPMVGLGAVTDGLVGPVEGIECTGYLLLPTIGADGRAHMIRQVGGRCWVASEHTLAELQRYGITSFAHHPIPYPHQGHDGNPNGFLTFSDALERSCNVYFETVADRLGEAGLARWYAAFGFGRRTGIGIEEAAGLIPGQRKVHPVMARMNTCFAGIGEGQMWATPLQVANEAATIARGGRWMRPSLLTEQSQAALNAVNPPPRNAPDAVVDLHLSPAALAQARLGMINVVNARSGTGNVLHFDDMVVAGKTGTAQGARLWQSKTGADGGVLLGPDGRPQREPMPFAVMGKGGIDTPTPTPWYRSGDGQRVEHAWFMGYAPADDPQIAFSVLVEYAGAGGNPAAGPIARAILEACRQDGYLHPGASPMPMAAAN
jgi:penicillin-binding protein 2